MTEGHHTKPEPATHEYLPLIHGWNAAQVQHRQQATAHTLQRDPIFHDRLSDGSPSPALVIIPAGRFLMGSPEDEAQRRTDEPQQADTTPVDAYQIPFAK